MCGCAKRIFDFIRLLQIIIKIIIIISDGVVEHGFASKCPQADLDETIANEVAAVAAAVEVEVEVVVEEVLVEVETDTGMFRKDFSSSFGMPTHH